MRARLPLAVFLISGLLAVAACNGKPGSPQTPQSTVKRSIDTANGATVDGVVKFTGTAPKPIPVDMSADPACKGQNLVQPITTKNGNLANVFVYIKSGLGDSGWTYSGPQIEIKQQGCRYVPHVIGVMTGHEVRIINADDTMHNIHPMPQHNHEWNAAQMSHGEPLIKKFDNPELMIPVKCNQHPWMTMYINVTDSPFFAVTDENGRFNISGLPPGIYTIAAVHETLGEQAQQLTVGPKETKSIGFTFTEQNSAAAAK